MSSATSHHRGLRRRADAHDIEHRFDVVDARLRAHVAVLLPERGGLRGTSHLLAQADHAEERGVVRRRALANAEGDVDRDQEGRRRGHHDRLVAVRVANLRQQQQECEDELTDDDDC